MFVCNFRQHLVMVLCAKLLQSWPTLCNPSPTVICVHGILQARILEWVSRHFFRVSAQLRDQTSGRFFTTLQSGKQIVTKATESSCCSVTQSCSTISDPKDCSTPGFPVHHQLLEHAQALVHRVSDVIQPFRPLSSPSPVFNVSQHQGLLQ